jgi:hypothetical protein
MVTELKEKTRGRRGMGTMGSWTAVRFAPHIKGRQRTQVHAKMNFNQSENKKRVCAVAETNPNCFRRETLCFLNFCFNYIAVKNGCEEARQACMHVGYSAG